MQEKHFLSEDAKRIGESLGVDWSKFDVEQFRMGMDVELEHGICDIHTNVTNDDPLVTGKIALAHLNEFPDYYTRLEKMEEEGDSTIEDLLKSVEKKGGKVTVVSSRHEAGRKLLGLGGVAALLRFPLNLRQVRDKNQT